MKLNIMQRATILRSSLARGATRAPSSHVQNCKRNVLVRARVETLFLEEGFVAPEFSLPWPEKGFEPISLMKDVVKVRLVLLTHMCSGGRPFWEVGRTTMRDS